MNLHKLVRSTRRAVDKPLFTGPVARKYRRQQQVLSDEEFLAGLVAGAEALRGLNLDDVYPANQTANVEVRD